MKFQLYINGMMCSHCTGRVEQTLRSLEGVTDVVVSLEGKFAQVTTTVQTAETLKAAIEQQGYTVVNVQQF